MAMPIDSIPLLRLLHLVSPTLPVGSFSYSQGLEWAVEAGWVSDEESLRGWLESILQSSLCRVDVPLLHLMYSACAGEDDGAIEGLTATILACRETRELREEERQRGRALAALLEHFPAGRHARKNSACRTFLGGYALAAFSWGVPCRQAVLGYLWSWLENQVVSGVKIIPLGQTQGQKILDRLIPLLPLVAEQGEGVPLAEVGGSAAALAIGSMLHETQYTRLYRS
jgi:urease accessory protein